jgi:hypothetical protein
MTDLPDPAPRAPSPWLVPALSRPIASIAIRPPTSEVAP